MESFNRSDDDGLNYNLWKNESHREENWYLGPFHTI